jgi:hypothetical protein
MTKQTLNIPIIKEASSWGPEDPHIPKPHMLAKEITKHLDLDDETKDEVDFFADRLMDKIESALMYYQLIMVSDFDGRNISQKRTIYEGLYANLWSFYKGRLQNYINKMGWNVDFIFCRDKNFEKNARNFTDNKPQQSEIIEYVRKQRKGWQTEFGHSRDTAEHNGDYRDRTNSFETPDDAKRLFAQVCWTAETYIAFFGSYKMKREWNVVEIKPGATIFDRDPRYIVEHAIMTTQREKQQEEKK